MDGIVALPRKLFGHRDDHAIARLRQGHASSGAHALILADLINVRTGLRVSDVTERASSITAASQILLGEGKHAIRLAILVKRHRSVVSHRSKDEAEDVVVGPATTVQHLLDGKGLVVIERAARTIGVGEFSLRLRTSSDRSRRSLRVVVFRRGYLIETSRRLLADEVFPARAQAADVERPAVLERVRRLAVVVKRDGERIAHGLIIRIADLGGEFLSLRLVDLDGKGERVVAKLGTIVALGDDQRLGDSQRTRLLDDKLSVVAQMAGNAAPRPQGVEHRRRRRRRIAILGRTQLVDIGNARSTRLEYRVTGSIGTDIAEQRLRDIARERDGARLRRRLPVANIVPTALVVIRAVWAQCALGGHRARLIRIDRRFLGHIVVAVGLCRSERRQGVAVFAAAPFVRVERHTVAGRVCFDVGSKGLIGVGQRALHVFLHTRLEEHANGERQIDIARACRFVNLEMTQRDERRGDLHFDEIARRQIIRLSHRDDDRAQVARRIEHVTRFTREGVRVDVSARRFHRVLEQLLRKHDRRKRIDLHVVAKLVGEGDISRSRRIIALLHFGGKARRARDLLGNLVEEGLQVGSIRSCFIEVGIGRARAEVPNPIGDKVTLVGIAGRRVVARHGVHEFVLTTGTVICRIGRRVRTAEDADGVNGRPRILHRLSSGDSRACHVVFKTTTLRRRTIGEEHHDLLGVLATRRLVSCKLQSIVGPRRTGRLNGVDGRLQVIRR